MIETLPRELIEAILIHLPLDSNLDSVAFASKRILAESLFRIEFAYTHTSHQLCVCSSQEDFENYLHKLRKIKWQGVPCSYQALIYCGVPLMHDVSNRRHRNHFQGLPAAKGFDFVQKIASYCWYGWSSKQDTACTAAYLGHTAVLQFLVEHTKSMYVLVANDYATIQIASERGHVSVVKLLLDSGVVQSWASRNIAIRKASENGHEDVVKLLLDHGAADPEACDDYAIGKAAKNGHAGVVNLLVGIPWVNSAAHGNYAIRFASERGHVSVVKILLDSGRVHPNAWRDYPIRLASENGHASVVKLLLESKNVDPGADLDYAIRKASENGHEAVVKLLLKSPKVDPAAWNNWPVRVASRNGHAAVVKLLLKTGKVNPIADFQCCRDIARNKGHTSVVLVLSEYYTKHQIDRWSFLKKE